MAPMLPNCRRSGSRGSEGLISKGATAARRTGGFIQIHVLLGAASLGVWSNVSISLSDITSQSAVRATVEMRGCGQDGL